MLETEGLEQQGQAGIRLDGKTVHSADTGQFLDEVAQHIGPQVAGIDAMAQGGKGFQNLPFLGDGFGQGDVAVCRGQGVAAPGFGKALDQHVIAAIKEDEAHIDAAFRFQGTQLAGQGGNAAATAHVHGHGHPFITVGSHLRHQLGQQQRRQVIYTVITRILQNPQCNTLAGPR